MTHRFGPCCLDAIRSAVAQHGYTAAGVDDWLDLGEGALDATHAVWHHDASARGFSPGMAGYIQGQVRGHKPGANIWVGLDGGWRFLAAGITYHAGPVLPGKPGNPSSVGIETDHTTGEDIGVHLLQSLRVGTAALFDHWQRDASALEFHKTICKPVRRKTDPDGLDLPEERSAVAALMEDDMNETDRADLREALRLLRGMNHQITVPGVGLQRLVKLAGQPTLDIDPADLAAAIADDLGDEVAQAVADELHRRLVG